MQIYKLYGNKNCGACGENADYYLEVLDVCLCKNCALELYKGLGVHFVPKAIPNVVLRHEQATVKRLSDALLQREENIAADDRKSQQIADEKCQQIKACEANGKSLLTRRNKWQSLKKK